MKFITSSIANESDLSVYDYFMYWMKEYVEVNCKLNTQRAYEQIIRNHIKKDIGIYKLKQISPAKLQELINLKYRNGFSKNYLSILHGVLSGAFKMAVNLYKFIKDNPMTHVSLPKYDTNKNSTDDFYIITMEDYKIIIERFPEGSNFYLPLQVAFHTGMRAAEVMGLTWDCINLENGFIQVEKILIRDKNKQWSFGTPKTASSVRNIKIGSTLISILRKHRESQLENKLKYGVYYKKHDYDFLFLKAF